MMKEKFKGMLDKLKEKFKNKFKGGKAGKLIGKMTGVKEEAGKIKVGAKRFGKLVKKAKK